MIPLEIIIQIGFILLGVLVGYIGTWLAEGPLSPMYRMLFRGYHIHHSTFGLFYLVFGLIAYFTLDKLVGFVLFGMGIGIILRHTISEEWAFFEKVAKDFKKTGIVMTKDLKEMLDNPDKYAKYFKKHN